MGRGEHWNRIYTTKTGPQNAAACLSFVTRQRVSRVNWVRISR